MQTKYTGYMGKVMMVDLSSDTVSEYPWSDAQRELFSAERSWPPGSSATI